MTHEQQLLYRLEELTKAEDDIITYGDDDTKQRLKSAYDEIIEELEN